MSHPRTFRQRRTRLSIFVLLALHAGSSLRPGYPASPPAQAESTVQFSAATFSANEGDTRATLTVTRAGDASAAASVDYRTLDNMQSTRCDAANGVAHPWCDYSTSIDTLRFAPGETQKTFTIPLTDDAHVEGPETLSVALRDPSGAALGAQSTAVLTIVDNDTSASAPNPVFNRQFFVRQHYLDFLSREPEASGAQAWLNVLSGCADENNTDGDAPAAACDRVRVSSSFFRSQEYQLKGAFVYFFYKVAYNRLPDYLEMIPDMRRVTGQTPAEVFQKRAAFTDAFVRRQEFRNAYDALSNGDYVDALLGRFGLTVINATDPSNPDLGATVALTRQQLIDALNSNTLTRAQVLRAIAQSREVDAREYNGAFVATQYYGYLRRTPEPEGYTRWLSHLNANPGDFRTMVNGFVNSQEYRMRFGADLSGDTAAPVIGITPADGATANTPTPTIEITYSDANPGVDTTTLVVKIDGLDQTKAFVVTPSKATCNFPLSGGQHTIEASIKDKAGNAAQATAKFTISVFRALPEAIPSSGPAPLNVTFITKAEYTDGAIIRYRWDFQGDGVFDTNDPGARDYTRTFSQRGTFNARLEVLNDKNQTATATVTVTVTNNPPTATASVDPSNGAAPLTVNFTGAGTDPDGTITKFEWDFDGDGVFDFSSTTTGNTTHTYQTAGTFNALFRVTDNDGQTATARATATAVRAGPAGSPTARITAPANPPSGNTPLTVNFNGTGTDADGTIAKFEWDFQSDGVFDFSSTTSAAASFRYESPGVFTAALRVTDNAGLTGVDTVDVTVNAVVTLSLSTDTCKPLDGGSVNVRTTLGGTLPVTIIMRNKAGQTVRTLVSNASRTAGSYTDAWDCKTDAGQIVPEGVYYAVLNYTANGQPRTLDLTNTTGGTFFNPNWTMSTTGGAGCFSCPFRPLEDNFLKVDFTLNSAAEVSVSIRLFNRVDEVAGLFDRRLFGRGPHTLFWDGTDSAGRIVAPPPGEQFLWGMTAFTLPTNAVYVETAPQITSVSADPNYFDPATGNFISPDKPTTKIAYTLTKQANVTLQVFRVGTNTLLRTVTQLNAPAGAGTVEWDGRSDGGVFADKGDYRLALKATDASGNQSIVRFVLVRVFY